MSNKMRSKKEVEDEKKKADEEAAAKAYEDFYNTFVDVPDTKSKVWVKAGTFDAGSRKEDTKERGKLYKPSSKLEELRDKFSSAERAAQSSVIPRIGDRPDRPGKKKEKEKKKSNLELFKEELKMIQEERAERHRVKSMCYRDTGRTTRFEAPEPKELPTGNQDNVSVDESKVPGSFDSGDPTTTNLYLGNLSPKFTEQKLMELFGRFGPLASIKIMWPRTDDERSRGRNCGFVAFMNRRDGERCLAFLKGRDIDGFEMKLGWGKSVPLPPHPIYIPPALLELTLPPPPSGLPFNAQSDRRDTSQIPKILGTAAPLDSERLALMDKILQRAVVKVVIPTERNLLQLIHRMIEFVIREGPMFEAMIMNREIDNPDFRFLFENQSPAHVYYRWKLFSILQGESQSRWQTKPFRMFTRGSIWKPPPLNPFLQGMPEELINTNIDLDDDKIKKGTLSDMQRKRFETMIRTLTPEREKIGEAMTWCIEHAESAEEICQCITESLTNPQTLLPKKIARLYLVSDILHNCCVKVANASFFRKYMQEKLFDMAEGLHDSYINIESRIRAEQAKKRVTSCFRAWEDWAVYSHDFLIKLQNIFMGITVKEPEEQQQLTPQKSPDMDGIPIDDVDGFPLRHEGEFNGSAAEDATNSSLLKRSAAISALQGYQDDEDEEDIDGAPLEDDIDGIPMYNSPTRRTAAPGFVPPKWESISPNKVESQAMTLSKWDELEGNKSPAGVSGSDSTPVYRSGNDQLEDVESMQDEEDLDGVPFEYSRYKENSSDSDSRADDLFKYEDKQYERTPGGSEEHRAKLRAVELKVLHYQDELERGLRPTKPGYSLPRQVQHYRHKLIRKIQRDSEDRRRRYRSSSSTEEKRTRKRTRRRSSRSPKRHRSRSPRKHRSYSRSPSSRKHKKKSRR